jgi:hypothetical protein
MHLSSASNSSSIVMTFGRLETHLAFCTSK